MLVELDGKAIKHLTGSSQIRETSKFRLARINMVRAACPPDILGCAENQVDTMPIVVTKNRSNYGYVQATQYCPASVVVAGAARRKALLADGVLRTFAWVEANSVDIQADDAIGCQELMDKLRAMVCSKYGGGCANSMVNSPWIVEVYPFEGYCIIAMDGHKYRQAFTLDPVTRAIAFSGLLTEVQEKFVNASTETMMRTQTGQRTAVAPAKGNNQTSTTGAANSELLTQIVRNWSDIEESVRMYLDVLKHGGRLQPKFAPVTLVNNKIAALLQAQGISMFHFARWSADAQESTTKSVGGDQVPRSKFAYAPTSDMSTWKLPIHDASHAKNALARINQVQGLPADKKAAVLQKVRKAASRHGVEVSDRPTSGQRKWVDHKVAAEATL